MNLSPMSVCREYAKSRAVVFCGRRKQSGRTFPFESASFEPAGKIAMYFRRLKTEWSRTSWTPVLPNLSSTFFCIEVRAFFWSTLRPSFNLKSFSP